MTSSATPIAATTRRTVRRAGCGVTGGPGWLMRPTLAHAARVGAAVAGDSERPPRAASMARWSCPSAAPVVGAASSGSRAAAWPRPGARPPDLINPAHPRLEIPAVKSAVETLNPTRVKLTVEVPFEELQPSLDAAYATIGSQIQVPGFRKGKVPPRIIDQRVGRGAVLAGGGQRGAAAVLRPGASRRTRSAPLGRPEVDVTEVPAEDRPASSSSPSRPTSARDRPCPTTPASPSRSTPQPPPTPTSRSGSPPCPALRHPHRCRAPGRRATSSPSTCAPIGGEEIDTVTGVSYEVGSRQHASTASTRPLDSA